MAVLARKVRPSANAPLVDVGRWLLEEGYRFTAVTPDTHRRVLLRSNSERVESLRDIFGWNKLFHPEVLSKSILELLIEADALAKHNGLLKSKVRFASVDRRLYVHSAYPTIDADSVFFGPDTYRFVGLIRRELPPTLCKRARLIVDVGCGSGVGGIVAAQTLVGSRVVLGDINPLALRYAEANAQLADVANYECVESDVLAGVTGAIDVIVSNPPYMYEPAGRAYRNGGENMGSELSIRIVRESLDRLAPGGRLILYTGAAIVEGRDLFHDAVVPLLREADSIFRYGEIDPDVFGDELDKPAYANVDRIAAVGLVAHAPRTKRNG